MGLKRLNDIDRAKGLAIVLVVLGHIFNPQTTIVEVEGYMLIKEIIYRFHMPFFMSLSGFIYYYTYNEIRSWSEYKSYLRKKLEKIVIAFALFAVIIFLGKAFVVKYMSVDNAAATGSWIGLIDIFIRPTDSVAGSLWYLYTISQFYLIFPVLLRISSNKVEFLVAFSLPLVFLEMTSLFALNMLCNYLFFFCFGMLCVKYYVKYAVYCQRFAILFVAIFFCSFFSLYAGYTVSKLIVGICSVPALYAIANNPLIVAKYDALRFIGVRTFVIYLMNTIVIGFMKGWLLKVGGWETQFYVILYISGLTVLGITMPVAIKYYVFDRNQLLRKLTD